MFRDCLNQSIEAEDTQELCAEVSCTNDVDRPSKPEEGPLESADNAVTLATLPVGAHLILRCRTDWRDATVIKIACDRVTLSVGSPTGRTYRVRRPSAALLSFDGSIPVLGEGSWRAGFTRYDMRW